MLAFILQIKPLLLSSYQAAWNIVHHTKNMAEEASKVSFSFSKTAKAPMVQLRLPMDDDGKQYIECLDRRSIKVKENETQAPVAKNIASKPLVIPLSTSSPLSKGSKLREIISQSDRSNSDQPAVPTDLDSIAVQELIDDARKTKLEKDIPTNFTLELPGTGGESNNDKESTLEDYESVPVTAYGLAMLRGMGWKPTKGIGKNEKVVEQLEPKVRPRGMGLGVVVERSSKPPAAKNNATNDEEELKIKKGAYVRVTDGRKKGMYGQIEGFDNLGALILKMALGGSSVSMNENLVEPVTKDEFVKNSRVLNSSKYKEYKDRELDGKSNSASAHSRSTYSSRSQLTRPSDNGRRNSHKKDEKRSRSRSRTPLRRRK